MQLISVLFVASLSSIGLAAPAGIFDKFCGPNNNSDDCLDENQNWGFVVDPVEQDNEEEDFSRPISFDPIRLPDKSSAAPAQPTVTPTVDPKEVCFNKSEEAWDKCMDVDKKDKLVCITESDKILDDCLKA